MNEKYSYPDKNDKVTIELVIKNSEPYPGYWEQSEFKALSFLEKRLSRTHDNGSLLDLASGEGRLLVQFARYFKNITALEPDNERISRNKKNSALKGITNLSYIEEPFLLANLPAESFDVILCSHLIQHIPTDLVIPTLEKCRVLLKPGGMMALTTNRAEGAGDMFEKQTDIIEKIDEKTFNSLTSNNQGILPVHYFSVRHLRDLLSAFHIKKTWQFHDEAKRSWPDRTFFRDTFLNLFHVPFGRDIFILIQKK